jgi:hypothetical protein
VSPAESIARATVWLQDLVSELSGLRNATSRDPSFKNWRQNAITTLQRIWPADQDHAERFRRIPFSPVDPRADVRMQRESFSRGCQEAARVLNSFIEEVRTLGVPEISGEVMVTEESGFEDGFPTVDLPSGDLSEGNWEQQAVHGLPGMPPQPLRNDTPPAPPAPEARPARKGLGVAAKLRDLLGLGGFAAKPTPAPPPPENVGSSGALPTALPRSLDIIPVGDEVNARPRPTPQLPARRPQPPANRPQVPAAQEGASSQPPAPQKPQAAGSTPPAANTPPAEPGMSVVMSRPTTLRSNIEKVSIESLISPEFRGEAGAGTGQPAAAPPTPGAQPAARPPLSIVPPLAGDPEFNVDPAPVGETPQHAHASGASNVAPLPPEVNEAEDAIEDETFSRADSAEMARATEDFMRSSPVLGATGRKVQRPASEPAGHGFHDPDAIAIISIVDELTVLGVPATRQSETRARLLDLSRRIENGELEWNALKKAVWFAMEYPEVARRLMPMLLPWIDRAA